MSKSRAKVEESSTEPIGVAAFFGTWPGDETAADLERMLDEVRHPERQKPDDLIERLAKIAAAAKALAEESADALEEARRNREDLGE